MQVDQRIFRAYDIRGIAMGDGAPLTNEVAYAIGQGIGTYMYREGCRHMLVGRDGRVTSPELQKQFIAGVLSTGMNVANTGLAVSPMVYFGTCLDAYDCGVNVTASHNPKEYNGFKLTRGSANSVCGEELQKIYQLIVEEDFLTGAGELVEVDLWPTYRDRLLLDINLRSDLKVVVDAANGVAGQFIEDLFKTAGVQATCLFTEVDGDFPNHEANPEKEENMQAVIKTVRAEKADLGIGFDGDGDRVGFVDHLGKFYSADLVLLQLARDLFKRHSGAKVVFDVKCSKVLENDVKEKGGVPLRSATGHSFIEQAMHDNGALLGGEISGHMFFAENYYGFDDAFLGALRVLQLVNDAGKPFADLFKDVPQVVNTPEIKIPCADDRKFELVAELVQRFQADGYTVLTVDGAFVEVDESTWGAVRCSNTSPNLTLRFEGLTEVDMKLVVKLFRDRMAEYPELDLRKLDSILLD